jgi:hypothetical protein
MPIPVPIPYNEVVKLSQNNNFPDDVHRYYDKIVKDLNKNIETGVSFPVTTKIRGEHYDIVEQACKLVSEKAIMCGYDSQFWPESVLESMPCQYQFCVTLGEPTEGKVTSTAERDLTILSEQNLLTCAEAKKCFENNMDVPEITDAINHFNEMIKSKHGFPMKHCILPSGTSYDSTQKLCALYTSLGYSVKQDWGPQMVEGKSIPVNYIVLQLKAR